MSKKKFAHLFGRMDIAASIEQGREVVATCGVKQVITKKDWKAGRGLPLCRKCIDLWSARQDGSVIGSRSPKDAPPTLPKQWPTRTYTVTYTNPSTTTIWTEWRSNGD